MGEGYGGAGKEEKSSMAMSRRRVWQSQRGGEGRHSHGKEKCVMATARIMAWWSRRGEGCHGLSKKNDMLE